MTAALSPLRRTHWDSARRSLSFNGPSFNARRLSSVNRTTGSALVGGISSHSQQRLNGEVRTV